MELIYLYVGEIDRPLKNQGVNFGNKFCVNYCAQEKKLVINERAKEMNCLYGAPFKSLDLIVGKNGTGKSTLLDILGLPKTSRFGLVPTAKNGNTLAEDKGRHTWFALYHIKDDLFALEGYWADMLDFMPKEEFGFLQSLYSVAFRYDMEKQCVLDGVRFLQDITTGDDDKRGKRVTTELFYVLYESVAENAWCERPFQSPGRDYYGDVICQRIYANHSGYEGLVKYLYDSIHNHEFAEKMASKPGATIALRVHRNSKVEFAGDTEADKYGREEIGKQVAGERVYGKSLELLEPVDPSVRQLFDSESKELFSHKESMVLVYLEELACFLVMQEEFPKHRVFEQKDNSYAERRDYLLDLLEDFNSADYYLAQNIVLGIEMIPDDYFASGTEAVIDLRDMQENFLQSLVRTLDINQLDAAHEINHRYFLRISFVGMSTGEAQYLDLHASLYNAIRNSEHSKGDTCVLLLDEPDSRFHPEWSRNFILNLTQLLKTEMFCDFNYQVIISTHSPLLVSDVPRKSIHCLWRENETDEVVVKDSQYGFMSNINDLITDSFFADSVFGAYAEQYVNRLIERIDDAEQRQKSGATVMFAEWEELEERLDVIDDDLIYTSLKRRMERLRARQERMMRT